MTAQHARTPLPRRTNRRTPPSRYRRLGRRLDPHAQRPERDPRGKRGASTLTEPPVIRKAHTSLRGLRCAGRHP
jgi:hypothetical protein